MLANISSIASAVTAIAMGTATSAYAVSFVSTLRGEPLLASDPPGIAEVGKIDPATGAYTTYCSYAGLRLTDIAVNNSGTVFGVTDDRLYTLNPGTNSQTNPRNPTVNGATAFGFNDLGFDNSNNLYALAGANPQNGQGNPGFHSINTATGQATLISNLGSLAPTAFGFAGSLSTGDTSDIAYNPTKNAFFAVSGNNNSQLFFINPTTGATTIIGNTGVGFISGLTFDGSVLRGYDIGKQQYVINPNTGVATSSLGLTGTPAILADGSNRFISGAASTINPTAVPEPFTIVVPTIGGVAALKMRKRLKATNKL